METWWLWNCFLKVNGKEELLPCVRMTAMTRPRGSPPVSPCPQVSQLESHTVILFSCEVFVLPLLNNPEILQLLIYDIGSFPALSVSPLCRFTLFSSALMYAVIAPILRQKQNPLEPHIPCSYHPFLCLILWWDSVKQLTCILSASSLPVFSQRHYIQMRPPTSSKENLDLLSKSPVTSLSTVLGICSLLVALGLWTTSSLASGFFPPLQVAPPQFLCWFLSFNCLSSCMHPAPLWTSYPAHSLQERSFSPLACYLQARHL